MNVFSSKVLMRQLASHKKSLNQGFTTIEVLVSILILTIFVAISLQAVVMAAAIRVRAQESSDAASWVETDLTVIRDQARDLGGYDAVAKTYSSIPASRCFATTATTGFANLLQASADNHPVVDSQDAAIGTDDTDPKLSPIGNRSYTLRRRTSTTDADPNVLRVEYDIYRGTDISTDPIIYSFYAEVIPGVAFACKQI